VGTRDAKALERSYQFMIFSASEERKRLASRISADGRNITIWSRPTASISVFATILPDVKALVCPT
jgi:hypothetical protein